MGGLSVLTSVPGGPPMVCLLCASKGLHEVGPLFFFHSPPSLHWPLLPDFLSPLKRVTFPGLLVSWCQSFILPAPSWCSAKSAVTLSTRSAWRRLSGPCPNIMTLGAAAAASSATSVGAKAGDLRFGHRAVAEGGGMEKRYSSASRFCHCCFSPISNSTSWSVNAAAMLTTQPAWGPATQPGPHANGATG